jgi:hypothetical protein
MEGATLWLGDHDGSELFEDSLKVRTPQAQVVQRQRDESRRGGRDGIAGPSVLPKLGSFCHLKNKIGGFLGER